MHKKCNYSAQFQRKMCLLEKMHHHRLLDWSVKNNSNDKSQSYSSGFWGMLYNAPDASKYGGQLLKTSNCEFKERNLTVFIIYYTNQKTLCRFLHNPHRFDVQLLFRRQTFILYLCGFFAVFTERFSSSEIPAQRQNWQKQESNNQKE